jgi:hypothetical protein
MWLCPALPYHRSPCLPALYPRARETASQKWSHFVLQVRMPVSYSFFLNFQDDPF